MATSAECQYKNKYYDYDKKQYDDFTCHEPMSDTGSKFCIFHDINYLKGYNYEKNKKEVADRFEEKRSKYPKGMPLKFIGYYLPGIPFENEKFTEALYFNGATFYGVADFSDATFSKEADFSGATFSNKAYFGHAKFSNKAYFDRL